MNRKMLISFVLVSFLILWPIHSVKADTISLFSSVKWTNEKNINFNNSQKVSFEIQDKLNKSRNDIGKLALLIVHPLASYEYTKPVSLAPRDGGGYILEMEIHWQRHLKIITRNHITKIAWEIVDTQHRKASVIYDDSTFSPIHEEELNDFFRELLPT